MKRKPWVVLTFVAALCLSLFSPANAQLVGDDAGAQDTLVLDSPESARQNTSYAWQGFPLTAKTPEETFILVSKEVPKEVRPGVEYSYKIMVTNNAAFQIDNVVLTERLPSNFEFACALSSRHWHHARWKSSPSPDPHPDPAWSAI